MQKHRLQRLYNGNNRNKLKGLYTAGFSPIGKF